MRLLRRNRDEGGLRIFYAADIHGSDTCWRKFLKAGDFYGVDVIILGGDLTGKAMVAVVRGPGGTWRAQFLGRVAEARESDELRALEAQIRFNGFYPYRCEPEELARLDTDPAARQSRFEEVMRDDVQRWMDLAAERLRGSPVTCLVMPGNDDGDYVADVVAQSAPAGNAEERLTEVKGVQFLSLGYSNITPWHTDRELGEDQLSEKIERLVKDLDPAGRGQARPHDRHQPWQRVQRGSAARVDRHPHRREGSQPPVRGGLSARDAGRLRQRPRAA